MTNSEQAQALRWRKFPVLDDGFVCLVDVMGSDEAVVQAARVSYGEGTRRVSDDRGLIRYLMRHRHTTPFEMAELKFLVRVPMDCWRQWIRHRTACLAGNTTLVFARPRDGKPYRMKVSDLFRKFQRSANFFRPDKQANPYYKREIIQSMLLRSLDEETHQPTYTQVADVWRSGVKQLFRVTIRTSHGKREIRASADHLFLTPQGWIKLKDLQDKVITISSRHGLPEPTFAKTNHHSEKWAPIVGWESYYEVSTQGRIRRVVGGKGSRSYGRDKKITLFSRKAVTSLNCPGKQEVVLVSREVLRAFMGESKGEMFAVHQNGNPLDNRLENLCWGTHQDRASTTKSLGRSTPLCAQQCDIVSIKPDGEEMTYDLEVTGPWHNFSANDFVVHNSVNEYSTRYSLAIDSAQATRPHQWRGQAASNRQGSEGMLESNLGAELTAEESKLQAFAREVYQRRLEANVAREQARKDLPLSTYTEAYWKIDLHNLLHFLSLRMDSHAQWEIRQYATTMGEQIVKPLFPQVWEAFADYRLSALFLTRLDREVIGRLTQRMASEKRVPASEEDFLAVQEPSWADLKRCREREECRQKLIALGLLEGET